MGPITKIEGVLLTPLKIIKGDKGSVYHAIRNFDNGFKGFGEAYFSTIEKGAIKAWKKHFKMTLNIAVPVGEIKIVLYDDRPNSSTKGMIDQINLSINNYFRLTIPPEIWVGFKGISDGINMLLNIADLPHKPDEQINIDILGNNIPYNWD
jgi:dTDP-4-dehydrorhamnose 3,5-epimerase